MKNVGWKVSINCLIYAHKQTKTLSGGIFNSPVWLLSEEKGEEGRKSMEYVLELKNIYKSFAGVKVLEDVTLQVRPGEVHALMGENGAGKSTLMKILMGIYKADQGSIFLEGKETVIHGPKDAMSKVISMIHQELNTVLDMEVAENVFVGRELLKKGFEKLKIVDIARMREETGKYFREMNIDIDPRAKMRTLSVAEMQLVEIVKAISLNSRIIVMDEPTSAITEKEATVLFAQIERLKKQAVAIIYGSIYGNTEQAADALAAKLGAKGVKNIAVYDASKTDVSELIAEIFRVSHVVIACPTYNGGIYPPIENLLAHMKALAVQNRTVAVMDNGTWAATAGKQIVKQLEEMKNMTVLDQKLSIKSTLKADQEDNLDAFAQQIIDAM